MPTRSLARAHLRSLNELVRLALVDLRVLFDRHDDPDDIRDDLLEALPVLIGLYGSAAATLAADWYDDLREAEGVTSRYRAAPAELPDAGRAESLAVWGVTPLYTAGNTRMAVQTAYTATSGGLQRVIVDAGRQTITRSTVEDPRSPGWERVTSGGCDWCEALAGPRTGEKFGSHDHCGCIAVPRFT